jgi:diguanylate cyclase (GGDEF)-like protein
MNQPGPSAKPKVIVIDDAPTNIRILDACLGDEFYLRFAASGAAGLQAVSQERPDLVLLDVMMPVMDGYEVCARLKADPETRDIPVIFVTGLNEVADEARGLSIGAADYIVKPIVPAIARARIRNQVELKRLRDRLERLSATDGLTGLANRRHFDEALEREWTRARRSQSPLSLIIMDVDHFKAFNDGYGHQAGDACLRQVAQALTAAVSRTGIDLVARYGGDEFVALLVDTGLEGARTVGERMRACLDALALTNPYSQAAGRVTLSLGLATLVPAADQGPAALLAAADAMLYRAKGQGRNRMVH